MAALRPRILKAAQRREAEVDAAGVDCCVIELQGDVRANHGQITERAAERRRLSGGGRPAGAKHQFHGVPRQPNDLLLDQDEAALRFIVQRLAGFDMLPRETPFRGGR